MSLDFSKRVGISNASERTPHVERFTPEQGQIEFVLQKTPANPDHIRFEVGGKNYDLHTDFTLLGKTITWVNTLFSLGPSDRVKITY